MNKYGIVFGAAVVAVVAGCKDPDYKRDGDTSSQNEVKNVDTGAPVKSSGGYQVEAPAAKRCNCLPGTKHDKPCACGAPDCACVVESKPVIVANLADGSGATAGTPGAATAAAEPETTVYIVQSGDYLAKISKKFNITIASIKKLNPSIKENNIVRVGQKLKLPGKVDVGVQAEPAKTAAKATAKKAYAPYTGATKEYVVKGGDTLGAIAYSNGISIRQLKELNGLSKDVLRVGQKLKIPATKVAAAKADAKTATKAAAAKAKAEVAAPAADAPAAPAADEAAATAAPAAPEAAAVAPAAPEAAAAAPAAPAAAAPAAATSAAAPATYVVQEGDDMTGVSIRWGVSAAEIRELNNLGEKDQLVPGQVIRLPADAQQ